jgi:small subunit ribosomal protein S17e
MGRIKTLWVKNLAHELMKKYPDKFSSDFSKNSEFLAQLNIIPSKKIKNKIAGFIARKAAAK